VVRAAGLPERGIRNMVASATCDHKEGENPMTSQEGLRLRLTYTLPAPPARVFAAWTEPDLLRQWWGPGAEVTCDPRPGGRYRWGARYDGAHLVVATGEFLAVERDRILQFTFTWEGEEESFATRVEVVLEPHGSATHLHLTHEGFDDERVCNQHESGWAAALDRLRQLLAAPDPPCS